MHRIRSPPCVNFISNKRNSCQQGGKINGQRILFICRRKESGC